MILVDTSVWIDASRNKKIRGFLQNCLENGRVVGHPWVVGELSLGRSRSKDHEPLKILSLLRMLPEISSTELIAFIRAHKLDGRGIGWVDVQLLASVRVTGDLLWSHDVHLNGVARELLCGWSPS